MFKLSTHYVRNILADLVKGASGAKFIEYQGPTMPMAPDAALAFFKTSSLEKLSLNRMMKELFKLPKAARPGMLATFPKDIREMASYKLLGNEAANVAKTLPGGYGHGAEHVFGVTRDVQDLTRNQPTGVKQRATIGALLHDVGREGEGKIQKQKWKKFVYEPQGVGSAHSELGGRFAKNFLAQNQQYVKNIRPGMNKVPNIIRAHDTDVHAVKPWTENKLIEDPAAGAVYLGDKTQAVGSMGAQRTVDTGKKFNETPQQTWAVAQNNLKKYDRIFNTFADENQLKLLRPKLKEYEDQMRYFGEHGVLPEAKAASLNKGASAEDFVKVLLMLDKEEAPAVEKFLKELLAKGSSGRSELFDAIYKLPLSKRLRALKFVADVRGIK